MSEPIGSLCVLLDGNKSDWIVSVCEGGGNRKVLRRFSNRTAAAEFAIEERARRTQTKMTNLTIHFPDDCPCSGNTLKW